MQESLKGIPIVEDTDMANDYPYVSGLTAEVLDGQFGFFKSFVFTDGRPDTNPAFNEEAYISDFCVDPDGFVYSAWDIPDNDWAEEYTVVVGHDNKGALRWIWRLNNSHCWPRNLFFHNGWLYLDFRYDADTGGKNAIVRINPVTGGVAAFKRVDDALTYIHFDGRYLGVFNRNNGIFVWRDALTLDVVGTPVQVVGGITSASCGRSSSGELLLAILDNDGSTSEYGWTVYKVRRASSGETLIDPFISHSGVDMAQLPVVFSDDRVYIYDVFGMGQMAFVYVYDLDGNLLHRWPRLANESGFMCARDGGGIWIKRGDPGSTYGWFLTGFSESGEILESYRFLHYHNAGLTVEANSSPNINSDKGVGAVTSGDSLIMSLWTSLPTTVAGTGSINQLVRFKRSRGISLTSVTLNARSDSYLKIERNPATPFIGAFTAAERACSPVAKPGTYFQPGSVTDPAGTSPGYEYTTIIMDPVVSTVTEV